MPRARGFRASIEDVKLECYVFVPILHVGRTQLQLVFNMGIKLPFYCSLQGLGLQMLPTSRLKSTNDCYPNLFLFESKGIHAEARGFGIQLCDPAARGWSLGKHLGVVAAAFLDRENFSLRGCVARI